MTEHNSRGQRRIRLSSKYSACWPFCSKRRMIFFNTSLLLLYFSEGKQVQSSSQSEVSDEQTRETVLGSAKAMIHGCYLRFTTAQINVLLKSISLVLSLKHIFPVLSFYFSKIIMSNNLAMHCNTI